MSESAEYARFRRALGEVVALSALPAVWAAYRLPQIVDDVADVLLRAVNLEFVYVTLFNDETPIAAARAKQGGNDTRRCTAAARRLLASGGNSAVATIPDQSDETRTHRATV